MSIHIEQGVQVLSSCAIKVNAAAAPHHSCVIHFVFFSLAGVVRTKHQLVFSPSTQEEDTWVIPEVKGNALWRLKFKSEAI